MDPAGILKAEHQEDPRVNHSLLEALFRLSALTVVAISVLPIVAALYSRLSLTINQPGVMVVSSRAKMMDVSYILASKTPESHIQYIRSEDSFAASLAITFKELTIRDGEIRFYEFKNRKAVGPMQTREALAEISRLTSMQNLSSSFPVIPAAIVLGLILTLFAPIKSALVTTNLFGAAGLSAVKVLTECRTCPVATIAGLNAGLVGLMLFSAMAIVSYLLPKYPESSRSGIPILRLLLVITLAITLLWQIVSWWELRLTCLPCSAIGLLCGWSFGSLTLRSFEVSKSALSLKGLAASATACLFLFGSQGGFKSDNAIELRQTPHLVSLGRAKPLSAANTKELGIRPPGERRVIFVAASGCHACDVALLTLDALKLKSITFYSATKDPPDLNHEWLPFPKPELIHSTPTTLLVQADGSIVRTLTGSSSDKLGSERYSRSIIDFLNDTNSNNEQ